MKKISALFFIFSSLEINAQWNFVTSFYGSGSTLTDFQFTTDSTGIFVVNAYSGPGTSSTNDLLTFNTNNYGYGSAFVDFLGGGPGYFPMYVQRLGQSDTIVRGNLISVDFTTDLGDNWAPFYNVSSGVFDKYDFYSGNLGIIYGFPYSEELYLCRNGNTSALPLLSASGFSQGSDIEMTSSSQVFIISDNNNKLITSLDTGYTWNLSLDTNTLFNHIEFTSSQVGYLSCNGGMVFKTTDAGSTWSLLSTGTTNDLLTSSFKNDTIGYVAGENGTILKTVDGGMNWTTQTIATTSYIYKIQTLENVSYCFAAFGDIYISGYANGIADSNILNSSLNIYPNPAIENITIENSTGGFIHTIQIFNVFGQGEFLQEVNGNDSQLKIDVSHLSKGIKTVVVKGEGIYTSKLVIE